MIKSPSMIGYLKKLVITGSKVADESQKWPKELRLGGTLECPESGFAKLNANFNLPSGFDLSNFIVFNSISRVDWSNYGSKSREIGCWKHVKTRLGGHYTETIP